MDRQGTTTGVFLSYLCVPEVCSDKVGKVTKLEGDNLVHGQGREKRKRERESCVIPRVVEEGSNE